MAGEELPQVVLFPPRGVRVGSRAKQSFRRSHTRIRFSPAPDNQGQARTRVRGEGRRGGEGAVEQSTPIRRAGRARTTRSAEGASGALPSTDASATPSDESKRKHGADGNPGASRVPLEAPTCRSLSPSPGPALSMRREP